MGTTPTHSLPYPDPATDKIGNSAAAIQALAEQTEDVLTSTYQKVFPLDQATYGDGVANAVEHIETQIDAANAAGGGFVYVEGTYRIARPFRAKSNVTLTGPGKIINSHTGGGTAAITCLPGNYHPANIATMPADALSSTVGGARTVTRSTTTVSLAVGDLVMIYATEDAYPQLTKVTGVSGSDVTLEDPVSHDFNGLTGYITKGGGTAITITPSEGAAVNVAPYFVENFNIDGVRMESASGPWTARAACLRGRFRTQIPKGHALVYGNAFTACTFDVTGTYTARLIELTDGARNNVIRVDGTYMEDSALTASEPMVKLGRGDVATTLRARETAARTSYLLNLIHRDCKIQNAEIEIAGTLSLAAVLSIGSSPTVRGIQVDRLRVKSLSAFSGTALVRIADATDFAVRDVEIDMPVSSGQGIKLSGTVTNGRLDRVRTPTGPLELTNASTTITNVTMDGCDVSAVTVTGTTTHAGKIKGRGNRVRSQDELAALAQDSLINSAIAATSETSALSRTFTATQAFYFNDRLWVDGVFQKTGTADTLRIKLTFGGVTLFDHTTVTTAGIYAIDGWISQVNQAGTEIQWVIRITNPSGAITTYTNRSTSWSLAAAQTVTLAAWKTNAADTLTIRSYGYRWQPFIER